MMAPPVGLKTVVKYAVVGVYLVPLTVTSTSCSSYMHRLLPCSWIVRVSKPRPTSAFLMGSDTSKS
jgi:hypothetical protein